MKTTIIRGHEGPQIVGKSYPWLGTYRGMVVEFIDGRTGVVRVANDDFPVGYHDNDWGEASFTLWNGAIQLEND